MTKEDLDKGFNLQTKIHSFEYSIKACEDALSDINECLSKELFYIDLFLWNNDKRHLSKDGDHRKILAFMLEHYKQCLIEAKKEFDNL